MPLSPALFVRLLCLLLLPCLLGACQRERKQQIADSGTLKQVKLNEAPAPKQLGTRERLLPAGPITRSSDGSAQVRLAAPYTPPGWQRVAKRAGFYIISMDVPGGGRCDVAVTGGDLEGNLKRWYGQFPQTSWPPAGLAALQTVRLAELPGYMVELNGLYEPGMGRPTRDGMQVYAMAASDGRGTVITVKLVGPKLRMTEQRAAFEQFCASLRPAE